MTQRSVVVLVVLAAVAPNRSTNGQTIGGKDVSLLKPAILTPLPSGQTKQSTKYNDHQSPGCKCHDDEVLELSPKLVSGTVGSPVTLTYDGAHICIGQGVRDLNGRDYAKEGTQRLGYVKWEATTYEYLPELSGKVSHVFTQAGDYSAEVKLELQCYDDGAKCFEPNNYKVCALSASVPIKIRPAPKSE